MFDVCLFLLCSCDRSPGRETLICVNSGDLMSVYSTMIINVFK